MEPKKKKIIPYASRRKGGVNGAKKSPWRFGLRLKKKVTEKTGEKNDKAVL